MKKIYSLLFVITFLFTSLSSKATIWPVQVGSGGNNFSPNSITNVMVGDTVWFVLISGTHNVTLTSTLPTGANVFGSSGNLTGLGYKYVANKAGTYSYQCTNHTGMTGSFTVLTAGIEEYNADLLTTAYPNPFTDKVTIKSNAIKLIDIYNVVGEKIKSVELSATENKTEIDFSNLPSGIYFYRTYKDGLVIETRKIVKAK